MLKLSDPRVTMGIGGCLPAMQRQDRLRVILAQRAKAIVHGQAGANPSVMLGEALQNVIRLVNHSRHSKRPGRSIGHASPSHVTALGRQA